MSSVVTRLVAVIAFVVALVWTTAADAKPKVAVAPIDGDDSGDMRDAVADALDSGDFDLVSTRTVTKAIDKLGYDGELSEKQAKKVAKELEADALVVAKLGRKGSNKTLKFQLFIGGKKAKGFKVTFNNQKSDNFKTKLREKFSERLGEKVARDSSDDEDEDGPKKTKKKKRASADDETATDDEDGGRKKRRRQDPDEDEQEDIDTAVARVSPHGANRVAVRADLGASFQNRTYTFNQRSKTEFPQGPANFKSKTVPGARFEGELYPLAFSKPKSFIGGLGVGGEYDRTLSLNLLTSTEPGVKIPTKQYHWSVGARIRIPFGFKDTSPSITLMFGYGKRAFSPDRSVLTTGILDIPTISYTQLEPGLAFRLPFVKQVALIGSGRGMLVRDAGPIQALTSYGRAKVTGIVGQAGLDITFANRFGLRIVGEFVQYGFSFVGNGTETNARDNDPSSKDIGGMTDRSFGGAATLAVLY